jgi:hypothetical protein
MLSIMRVGGFAHLVDARNTVPECIRSQPIAVVRDAEGDDVSETRRRVHAAELDAFLAGRWGIKVKWDGAHVTSWRLRNLMEIRDLDFSRRVDNCPGQKGRAREWLGVVLHTSTIPA